MAKKLVPAINKLADSMITEALRINQGNRAAAARDLGISYKALRCWLSKLEGEAVEAVAVNRAIKRSLTL